MKKDIDLKNDVNGVGCVNGASGMNSVNSHYIDDDSLRRFFQDNRPSVSDDTTFLVGLSARMDAMESIREIHENEIRRCRRHSVIALVAGIVIGIAAVLLLMFGTDLHVPLLTFQTNLLKGLDMDAPGLAIIASAAALIYGLYDSFRWKNQGTGL